MSLSVFMTNSFKKASFALMTAAALLGVNSARASVIDLGAAGGYSVLTYNSSNVSDSAFQGGPIGVVNGSWTQSGGAQTNTQLPTTVFLSSNSFSNGGPAVEATSINPGQLSSAWSAATNLSSNLSTLTPTQVLGNVTTNTSITETAVGNYVLSIGNINLNHPASLSLSAPAGSTFVLNISGSVTINGAMGSGLLIGGGLTSNDVVYNFTNGGSLTTAGGGNGSLIQGIVLDPNGSVGLHPGEVDGEIIAGSFSSSSGSLVSSPGSSVPETSTILPLLGVIGIVVCGPAIRRKLAAA